MNIEQVRDFTLSLHGVTEDQPKAVRVKYGSY